MDNEETRKQELRQKVLATPVLPWYLGISHQPSESRKLFDPYPGSGGIPDEPLPELQAQISTHKRETKIYKCSPYESPTEDTELEFPKTPVTDIARPPLLVCKDLDEYIVRGVTPVSIADATVLINIIRSYPELGFLYLRRCSFDHKINYNPYYFTVCNYFDVDPKHYFTISQFGFAEFFAGSSDFVPLDRFESDYKNHLKLLQNNFFANYYLSKFFKKWRLKMRKQKWLNLRRTMSEILIFRLHPHMINQKAWDAL